MDPLAPLIKALHDEGRLRVWSLIITIFGDLIQHRGGEVSTARLRMLLGRVGVEQGALRTALSRLSSDGWVTSERDGRTSFYRLSAEGMEQFAPATARIYASPRTAPVEQWAAVVSLGENGAQTVRICPRDEVRGAVDCQVVGNLMQVSGSYRASLLSESHRYALAALAADLSAIGNGVNSSLDAAAARMLLIHRWRRIVLRYPEIAADLMPGDTPLPNPRRAVAEAYAALSPGAEGWLNSPDDGMRALPNATVDFGNRFGGIQRA